MHYKKISIDTNIFKKFHIIKIARNNSLSNNLSISKLSDQSNIPFFSIKYNIPENCIIKKTKIYDVVKYGRVIAKRTNKFFVWKLE